MLNNPAGGPVGSLDPFPVRVGQMPPVAATDVLATHAATHPTTASHLSRCPAPGARVRQLRVTVPAGLAGSQIRERLQLGHLSTRPPCNAE
jgi:hypothetical protein